MEEDKGALVRSLYDKENEIASKTEFRCSVKKQYCNLGRRLKLLVPMFEEIRDSKEPIPEETMKALVSLKDSMVSAKEVPRFD